MAALMHVTRLQNILNALKYRIPNSAFQTNFVDSAFAAFAAGSGSYNGLGTLAALQALNTELSGIDIDDVYSGSSTLSVSEIKAIDELKSAIQTEIAQTAGFVDSSALASGAVGTAALADNAVTSGKIADGAVTADKLADVYGNGGNQDLNTLIGSVDISGVDVGTDSITGAIAALNSAISNVATEGENDIGRQTLSYTFTRDSGGYDVTATTIKDSLLDVLSSSVSYASATELATAIVNAIGASTPSATISQFAADFTAVLAQGTGNVDENFDTLAEIQAGLYSAVDAAAATSTGLTTALTNDLGLTTAIGSAATDSAISEDIEASVLLDPVTITSAIGQAALTTDAKTLVGAINELDADIGNGDITGVSTASDSITGIIGTASLTTTAQTLSGAINELVISIGSGGGLTLGGVTADNFYGCVNGVQNADIAAPTKTDSNSVIESILQCVKWSQDTGGDLSYATINDDTCGDVISNRGDAMALCIGMILPQNAYDTI